VVLAPDRARPCPGAAPRCRSPRRTRAIAGRTGLQTWRETLPKIGRPGKPRGGPGGPLREERQDLRRAVPSPSSSSPVSLVVSCLPSSPAPRGRGCRARGVAVFLVHGRVALLAVAGVHVDHDDDEAFPGPRRPRGPFSKVHAGAGTRCTSWPRSRGGPACAPRRAVAERRRDLGLAVRVDVVDVRPHLGVLGVGASEAGGWEQGEDGRARRAQASGLSW
jgi:hypothetical protein